MKVGCKGVYIKNKIIIIGLLVCSVILSFLQLSTKAEIPSVKVIGAKMDIKRGETIAQEHLTEIEIDERHRIDSYSLSLDDYVGKVSDVDIPKGALLSTSYLRTQTWKDVPKGRALTAIKLMPDSAICWTPETESILDVYFVDPEGELEVLGKVRLLQVYDQNMGAEDMLFYAVVEGSENVIAKIVQKRALGRIEVVKTQ